MRVRRRRASGLSESRERGTFTSTERRIQRLYQVFEPTEGSRPDWWIIQEIAKRLGAGWTYQHPSEIMDEIASLTPMFAGVNYERLEGYKSLQWPSPRMAPISRCCIKNDSRSPTAKRDCFHSSGVRLWSVPTPSSICT